MTTSEFNRISGVVLGGLKAIITNFSNTVGQLSGPVAIVAKGSEIARTDSAGGWQCGVMRRGVGRMQAPPASAWPLAVAGEGEMSAALDAQVQASNSSPGRPHP
jgi:hypothetical protein